MDRRIAVSLVAALVAVAVVPASSASADHVQCGAVLTQDTSLDGDIICESGEPAALTAGADGITLDLNGHRVEYRGSLLDDAVGVSGGGIARRDVTVANGTITGFTRAISFVAEGQAALTNGTVRDVTVDGVETIRIDGTANVVAGSTVTGIDVPLALHGPDSSIVDNDVTGAPGLIGVSADSNARIAGNRVSVPQSQDPTHRPVAAIQVTGHHAALIARNTVSSPTRGIVVLAGDGTGTVIERNRVTRTPSPADLTEGIDVDGSSLARGNSVAGFFDGIVLNEAASAVRNIMRGNHHGITSRSTGRVEHNVASQNEVGIAVYSSSLVRGNATSRNAGSGIFALSEPGQPATIAGNKANFNGRYGIEAQNVIDGRGNRARGNAFSPQCLGVVCR